MKEALLIGVGMLLFPPLALAEGTPNSEHATSAQERLDPDAPPPTVHVVDEPAPQLPLIPRAPDLLGSHVLLGAAVGPAWSLGSFSSGVASRRAFGTGLAVHADAGIGVSRSVVLGAWGSFAGYGSGNDCSSSCSGRAFAVGPYVRYHLAQGLRFDPWLTLGAGYRQVAFDSPTGERQKFSGFEWLHFELGADYYLLSGVGFGPYGSLGLSSYTTRPSGSGNASVNPELSAGLRFLFDLPGR